MPTDDLLDSLLDELLDRSLRGEAVDIEACLAQHPELSDAERERLRARARVLGTQAASALPFERLGDFKLLAQLGAGGMGVVYLAEQLSLGRKVALKVMRPELLGSATAQRRFEREAHVVAQLRHPNIVAVHALGLDGGVHYLAMDLIEGQSLDEILRDANARNAPIAPAQAVRWALEVARALEAAHGAGVIHRDVKPSNVRIARDGRALLVDFGLSLASDLPTLTANDAFQGTPYFASPEQIDSPRELDARTDVYSLGATLYQCVTGNAPFAGRTTAEVFHGILAREPTAPRRLRPALSRDLETVIQKAMEKDVARRYASARELAADLEALLEMRPVAARPTGRLVRTIKWARRNRAAAAGIALAAATLVIALAAAWIGRRRDALAFEREVASANAHAAAGEHEAAVSAIDRAIGLRPSDATALARRAELVAAKSRAECDAAVESARTMLADYREHVAQAAAVERELAPLRAAVTTRYMSADEHARNAHLEDVLEATRRQLELESSSIVDTLNFARGLDPANTSARDVLADLYLERWRDAVARNDAGEVQHYRELVLANDAGERHRAELAGTGTLSLESDPPGAQAFLFRFVDQSRVVEGGEHRLVPVPIGAVSATPAPGTWCLRVVEDVGELRANDLIVSVAGHPIQGTLLVSEGGPQLQRLDRLVTIDDLPVREIQDVNVLGKRATEAPKRFEFERAGRRFTLEAQTLRELLSGGWAVEPDTLVEGYVAPAELFHLGATRTITTPGHLRTRTTAAPLFASPACCIGATPVSERELEPGSYLALLRRDGCEDTRVPFVVERGGRARVSARLWPADTSPLGFVFVPGGAFRSGGDAEAFGAATAALREVDDFWIMDREINEVEYAAFLNDPETLAEIDHSPVPIRGPRSVVVRDDYTWTRDANGHFVVPFPRNGYPIGAIACDDAEAFARWFDARAAEDGDPFTYALPSEDEWEKAARGVDGRDFVYGDRFCAGWAKGRFGRDAVRDSEMMFEPTLRFPRDESVYGIFDLCGSQWEFCSGVPDGEPDHCALRGGARSFVYVANFRAAARGMTSRSDTQAEYGFRLVAHWRVNRR